MLERSKISVNSLTERFTKGTGRKVAIRMARSDADNALIDFPSLSDKYLRTLTFGVYQLKQASSYWLEHIHIDKYGSYNIFVGKNMPDIIQAKIQSSHVSSKSYYLWIHFDVLDKKDPIKVWYCQCIGKKPIFLTTSYLEYYQLMIISQFVSKYFYALTQFL